MNKWSKEEVNLCKQVAERHRKYIGYGGWFLNAWGKVSCACGYAYPVNRPVRREYENPKWIALWTISDCLEWLKERYDDVNMGSIEDEWDAQVNDAYDRVHHPEFLEDIRGKTPLEALLKAVLAVLEEVE